MSAGVEAAQEDGLLAAALSGDDVDVALGQAQEIGEELGEGAVGGAFDRRGREPDPERAVGDPVHLRAAGAGGHANG